MRLVLAAILFACFAMPAVAVDPSEMLKDPVLEARARTISEGLRCLVCQNESIDDSDADLAHEIRVIVRQRLVAGDSDSQVVQYLVDRYGEFVLLKPVLAPHTLVLWLAAPTLLIVGGTVLFIAARRRRTAPKPVLTTAEQQALDELNS